MKGSARRCVSGRRHERMLKLSGHPSDVEHAVAAFHPLEIDRRDVEPVAEQEVRRGGVAVQQHLLVLPHVRSLAPQVAQPAEFVHIP